MLRVKEEIYFEDITEMHDYIRNYVQDKYYMLEIIKRFKTEDRRIKVVIHYLI